MKGLPVWWNLLIMIVLWLEAFLLAPLGYWRWVCFGLGIVMAWLAIDKQYQENVEHDSESLRVLHEDSVKGEVSVIEREFDNQL